MPIAWGQPVVSVKAKRLAGGGFSTSNLKAIEAASADFVLQRAHDGARLSRRPDGPAYSTTSGTLSLYAWDSPGEGVRMVLSDSNEATDWGTGPTLHLYDLFDGDFEVGEKPPLSGTFGRWGAMASTMELAGEGHTGNRAPIVLNPYRKRMDAYFEPTRELFISYCVKIPEGRSMPGAELPDVFPVDSVWKMTWIVNKDTAGGDVDFCTPSWAGYSSYGPTFAGNNTGSGSILDTWGSRQHPKEDYWRWNQWMRISVWLKTGDVPHVDPGRGLIQVVTEGEGIFDVFDYDGVMMPDRPDDRQYWKEAWFPGWADPSKHGGDVTNCQAIYDDIYVATGTNANNRIELGASSVYGNNTRLQLCQPVKWQPRRIEFLARKGTIPDIIGSHLHVTTGDEQHLSVMEITA